MNDSRISLRRTTADDMMLYFAWANDPEVRANSFTQDIITLEAHERWFASKLADENTVMYVFECDGVPAGQIRFALANGAAEIGFSIAKEFRGKGLGTEILRRSCEMLWNERGTNLIIRGAVKTANTASSRAFERAGFTTMDDSTNDVFFYAKRY
jgi:RimJ/RimL family protein N-acetyltransferase